MPFVLLEVAAYLLTILEEIRALGTKADQSRELSDLVSI
jgi:hypothetical protein